MNKFVNIVILLLLAVFISFRINIACNELSKSGNTNAGNIAEIQTPLTFMGTIFCDDCPDTEVHLLIDEHTYHLKHIRPGNAGITFEEHGSWEIRTDTLFTFDAASNGTNSYLLGQDGLIPINITAGETHPEVLEKTNAD